MKFVDATHYGRSWSGHRIEDACPCSQELCGLVSDETRHSDCEQHTIAKTIRQTHLASDCPGEPSPDTVAPAPYDPWESTTTPAQLVYAAQAALHQLANLRALVRTDERLAGSHMAVELRLHGALLHFDEEDWIPNQRRRTLCSRCGARFRPQRSNSRFCSDRCRWAVAKANQRARESKP